MGFMDFSQQEKFAGAKTPAKLYYTMASTISSTD